MTTSVSLGEAELRRPAHHLRATIPSNAAHPRRRVCSPVPARPRGAAHHGAALPPDPRPALCDNLGALPASLRALSPATGEVLVTRDPTGYRRTGWIFWILAALLLLFIVLPLVVTIVQADGAGW